MHVVSWCDWSPSLLQSRRLSHARADAGALQSICAIERLVRMSRVISLYPDNLNTTRFSALGITINVHGRSVRLSPMGVWMCGQIWMRSIVVHWYIRTVHLLVDCHWDMFQHRRRGNPHIEKLGKKKVWRHLLLSLDSLTLTLTWSHPSFCYQFRFISKTTSFNSQIVWDTITWFFNPAFN